MRRRGLIHSMIFRGNTPLSTGIGRVFSRVEMFTFAAIRTENIRTFGEKASTDQRRSTALTGETIIVPMSFFKRDVSRASHT